MAAGPERAEEPGPLPCIDLSINWGPLMIRLRINDQVAGRIITGGLVTTGIIGLAWFCRSHPELVRSAITNALVRPGLQVGNVAPGSILVELHCHTIESFQSFMEAFEAGKVMQRLNEEFTKIGYKWGLEVTITNDSEVYERLHKIRKTPSVKERAEDDRTRQTMSGTQHPQEEIKPGVPSDKELNDLAGNIVLVWKKLGRRLGIKDDKLDEIEVFEKRDAPFKMLRHWKTTNTSKATYHVLHEALSHFGRRDLAKYFCRQ